MRSVFRYLMVTIGVILASGSFVFAQTGKIWIITTPGEVSVKLDGIDIGKSDSDGAFSIGIPQGEHKFEFSKKEFEPQSKKVIIGATNAPLKVKLRSMADVQKELDKIAADKKAKDDAAKKAAEAKKEKFGGLKITSNAKGGDVSLNGKFIEYIDDRGVCFIKKVKAGKYNLKITHESFKSYESEINIKPNIANNFKFNLKYKPGKKPVVKKKSFFSEKKNMLLVIAGGGLFLIILAIVLMIVSSRKRSGGMAHNTGMTQGSGSGTGVGIFTTSGEEGLDELLQGGNIDVLVGKKVLGDYFIEKKIGEGGMGAIMLANQESLDRKTALKIR